MFDVVYWIAILIYTFDILFSFNSDIRVKFEIITDRKEISRHYLKNKFWVDLIPVLPLGIFYSWIVPVPTKFFFIIIQKILFLLPLIKLLKVKFIIGELQESLNINPNVRRLIALAYWFIIGIHFIALGWCFIGASEQNRSFFDQYLRAIYWGMTTIATIGYGDYSPSKDSNLHIVYTIIVELTGVAVFGYIIGNIANLIANIDMAKARFSKHLEEINVYLQAKQIPNQLQQKVNNYYYYLWETRKGVPGQSLLENMPHTLKEEILLFLNRSIIEKVTIFKNTNELFLREIVQLLELKVFLPNDYIIRQGELGDCMYFLNSGEVEVIVGDKIVAQLGSGSPFGETALLQDEKRMASIKAITYCEVYKLTKSDFDILRKNYSEFDEQVKEVVRQRLEDTKQKTK